MAITTPPSGQVPGGAGKPPNGEPEAARDVELLKVVVSRDGKKVTAQWAIHPQIKHDLLPDEWKELSDIMTQVTNLVGTRFAQVLSGTEPDQSGSA